MFWANSILRAIRESDGKLVGFAKVVRDLTEQTRTEDLERAKEAADQANRMKDHFLAVLSHELRTPLAPVIPTLAMLHEDPRLAPELREPVELIRRNVELEARLIDDLLDVTRIARGKVELGRRPVRLEGILTAAVEVCQPDIEARQLHFGVDAPDGPYVVDADPARLQQVFWNLLRNAIKFTPQGGCVGIRCHRESAKEVLVEVKDSGVGIAPEALVRIFDPFEQAERSITRRFGGLGLGLAITKAMVEMHGGTIQAHSDGHNRGATFAVRLPLLATDALARTDSQQQTPAVAASRAARPLRILLVEDHGDTAKTMMRVLKLSGHSVIHAGDVATAMKLARETSFDLLLSDLGLPDASGLDLLQGLRAAGFNLPAIALSGYGQEQDLRQSREAGFARHLVKPVDLMALEAAIHDLTSLAGNRSA